MLAEAGGDFMALSAAAEAGTLSEAPPPNTLTEDDLQKEIAKAVQVRALTRTLTRTRTLTLTLTLTLTSRTPSGGATMPYAPRTP